MRKLLWIACLLALGAHLAYFAAGRDHLTFDSGVYIRTAENLLHGRGFIDEGQPETRRTPGYPALLAALDALGLGLRGIVLVQHLLCVAMVALLFLATLRMTGSAFVAAAAALVLAIDLPTIDSANSILTETAFTLLLLLVFVLAWRIGEGASLREAAVAGLLLGLSALVRPISVFFFVPLALFFVWTRRRRVVPLFAACALLLPGLWVLRNYRAAGVATLSSVSGDSMLFFRAAGVLAIQEPGDFYVNLKRHQNELQALADRHVPRDLPHAQRAKVHMRLGREIVMQHPLAYAKLVARGIAATLLGGGATAITRVTAFQRATAERMLLVYTGAALLLALIGQVILLKTNRRLGILILITLAYFIILPAGAESYSRFRVPVVPMYAIAIAAGLETVTRRPSRSRKLQSRA